jgi:hypothetical protein
MDFVGKGKPLTRKGMVEVLNQMGLGHREPVPEKKTGI